MINKGELLQLDAVKRILAEGEEIALVVVQRRIGPGGALIFPKIVVATNERVIIGSRKMWGIHRDFEVIAYRAIRDVKLEHGLVSSTVIIASEFYGRSLSEQMPEEYGKIFGLRYNDAIRLVEFLDKKISDYAAHAETVTESGEIIKQGERPVACRSCGTKNSVYSNYCSVCGAKL